MQSSLMKAALGNQTPPKENVLACPSPLWAIAAVEGEKSKERVKSNSSGRAGQV